MSRSPSIVIVGNPEEVHVAAHFTRAAAALGIAVAVADAREAYGGPAWKRRANWWLRGKRPSRLDAFETVVLDMVRARGATVLLTTGLAPIGRKAIDRARRMDVVTVNFLTDDPWNPSHRAPWFFEALGAYDHVFSPRTANLEDLQALRSGRVSAYLPFAYDPDVHYPDPTARTEAVAGEVDVFFAGNADGDRRAIAGALIAAGFNVALYGDYWQRYQETRRFARGFLDAAGLRRETGRAKVALCLVRRANRDGHAMRSFEVPAMAGCVLAEDTPDHRRILGPEGEAATYYTTADEAVERVRRLVADLEGRRRLAAAARAAVTRDRNTYRDRLETLLSVAGHVTA